MFRFVLHCNSLNYNRPKITFDPAMLYFQKVIKTLFNSNF